MNMLSRLFTPLCAGRRIPKLCLARIDGGDVPTVNHLGDKLEALTPVEMTLIGRAKPVQQLYTVYLSHRPPSARPLAVRSHGVVVPNPAPEFLRAQLPMRASELPGDITLLSIDAVESHDELVALAKQAHPAMVCS